MAKLALVPVLLVFLSWAWIEFRVDNDLKNVTLDMTREEILELFGEPDHVTGRFIHLPRDRSDWWYEYWYVWDYLFPVSYLSANRRAIYFKFDDINENQLIWIAEKPAYQPVLLQYLSREPSQ